MKHKINDFVICDGIPDTVGWSSIKHMILLMSELFESRVIKLPEYSPNKFQKTFHLFDKPRKRDETSGANLLIVATTLGCANDFLSLNKEKHQYNKVAFWIIDSSFTNHIPFLASSKYFDHLFITSGNDISIYQEKTNIKTSFLGYGSDVYRLGAPNRDRKVDVLRVGRQPNRFDNDEVNENQLKSFNLTYQGRPDFDASYIDLLNKYYLQAKYVLAHSNLADESNHTHTDKEYITTRWTDALACGCTIVGQQPKSDYAYQQYIWPEAVIDIDSSDKCVDGSDLIGNVKKWSPEIAEFNYMMALKRLDWRWRFKELSDFFCINCEKLNDELREIEKIIYSYQDKNV